MQALTLEPVARISRKKLTASPAKTVRPGVWIIAAALVALFAKLAIASTTFGTNDVAGFYKFAQFLSQHGLEWTYTNSYSFAFNHPPLIAHYLELIYKLNQQPWFERNGIMFPFLLRLPAIVADFVSVLVLLRLIREIPQIRVPTWALVLFALSPVSVMVSGFHGNTDPLMVMFLLLAAYASTRESPVLCGLFFALSCQVKIIPLLLFPIFFFHWHYRRASLRFIVPLAAVSLILMNEAVVNFPGVLLKNVFSYGSFWGLWGITYFLRLTGWTQFGRVSYYDLTSAQMVVGALLKLLIIACVLAIAWRRRALPATALLGSLAYAWIVFFVFSPGVCAQYMVWLVPFVLLLSPLLYGCLELTSTLFLFCFYNTIADAFPWYIAISTDQNNGAWPRWSVLPWAVLSAGMIVLWRIAQRSDPSLRLFSLREMCTAAAAVTR